MVTRDQGSNATSGVCFPPKGVVRLDGETLRRAHEIGREFRVEILKRSATMYAPTTSEPAKKVR